MNSRHLIYEAQQAHYYGLPPSKALSSVTSTPATVLGYDHRIGFLKLGYDAGPVYHHSFFNASLTQGWQMLLFGIVVLWH